MKLLARIPDRGGMSKKPHLKLTSTGRIFVLAGANLPWNAGQARRFIREHYGSVEKFAARFNLPYGAACEATHPGRDHFNARRAGDVAVVRKILGLVSNPTLRSERVARTHARRRSVSPRFTPASAAPESQSHIDGQSTPAASGRHPLISPLPSELY